MLLTGRNSGAKRRTVERLSGWETESETLRLYSLKGKRLVAVEGRWLQVGVSARRKKQCNGEFAVATQRSSLPTAILYTSLFKVLAINLHVICFTIWDKDKLSINSFNTDVHFSSYPATFTRRVIISILPATRDLPDNSTYQCWKKR